MQFDSLVEPEMQARQIETDRDGLLANIRLFRTLIRHFEVAPGMRTDSVSNATKNQPVL